MHESGEGEDGIVLRRKRRTCVAVHVPLSSLTRPDPLCHPTQCEPHSIAGSHPHANGNDNIKSE